MPFFVILAQRLELYLSVGLNLLNDVVNSNYNLQLPCFLYFGEILKSPSTLSKKVLSIQEYLSLGYIFLLVLGIISDAIYYQFLGINILSYTTISDVLLSPINLMGENIALPIFVVASVTILYYNRTIWGPKTHEKFKHHKWYRKTFNVDKLSRKYQSEFTINDTLQMAAIGVLICFLGIGIGRGSKIKSRIENKNLKIENLIEFEDGKQQKIALLGQNSLYLFYVEEVGTTLTISPIENNVKKITAIELD